ncbi:MAG: HAD family hydrolase [Thermodesulfovibrionales bacterium]
MKLVLFDIDGTLLDSGGAGTRALDLAFSEVYSITEAFRGIRMAGKTDTEIIGEALLRHGIDRSDEASPALTRVYLKYLALEIKNDRKRLKPGVEETLERLGSQPGVRLGLLTGNIEGGAEIKIGAFGLERHFLPKNGAGGEPGRLLGAFGSDNADRNLLLPIAVRKLAEDCGKTVSFADCVVVGDTPRDINCARPYGARAVGVATGPYSLEDLRAAGADLVISDLAQGSGHLDALLAEGRDLSPSS